jgi:hypothetical protein
MPVPPDGFRVDQLAYGTDAFFPAAWAEAETYGIWGGFNTGRVLVNPVRYNPATGQLQVASSVTVRVEFDGSPEVMAYPVNPSLLASASGQLVNFPDFRLLPRLPLMLWAPNTSFWCTRTTTMRSCRSSSFYHSPLVMNHSRDIYHRPSSGALKAAIADNYDSATTRFALIVGTDTEMPSYNYGSFIGDYWYACVVGTDLLPEVSVGRLTGSSAQISHQVDKIIDGYLQYSFSDRLTPGIIPSTTVLAAHQEQYPYKYTQCCNEIAAYNYSLCDMTFYKIYPPEGGTNAMVSEWFNNGIGTVGYRGHGDVTVWSWGAPVHGPRAILTLSPTPSCHRCSPSPASAAGTSRRVPFRELPVGHRGFQRQPGRQRPQLHQPQPRLHEADLHQALRRGDIQRRRGDQCRNGGHYEHPRQPR